MLLSLPGFKGSRDGVLGSPPSSSVPRGPRVGFHPAQHHECHAQLWSKPFLEGQGDNIKVASKVLPKTMSRATSTARGPLLRSLSKSAEPTASFRSAPVHSPFYQQAKNPGEFSEGNLPCPHPAQSEHIRTISLAPGSMHFYFTM